MRPDDFVVARNPDDASTLPYLIRLPLGSRGVVLKARDTWPRTTKVYCHRADAWPAEPEVVERVPVRSCVRRGAAIDLVLDRPRENRSQIVFTRLRTGREAVFWQSARTAKQARPKVRLPTRRAAGLDALEIVVDGREKYAYRFSHQQVTTRRAHLRAGDYGVEAGGELLAAVERKSLADLTHSLLEHRLEYALADLAALPRAAVVVEDRYSRVFGLEYARPGAVADLLAQAQVRWPTVPIVFCETRGLAEEWTFRFLGAAYAELSHQSAAADVLAELVPAGPLPPPPPPRSLPSSAPTTGPTTSPTTAQVRVWALGQGLPVADRGPAAAAGVGGLPRRPSSGTRGG